MVLLAPVKFSVRNLRLLFRRRAGEVAKEGYALAIRDDLAEIVKSQAFAQHMGDIIDYRTMDYYQRRYHGNCV